MLTKKGKYALKAMVDLAYYPPGQYAAAPDIAERQNIPKKFLEGILAELRIAGFVTSKSGKGGGYRLARRADAIGVGDVIRAIDGPFAPIPCASDTHYQRCDDCFDETSCSVRRLMQRAQQALCEVLDGCSLERMMHLAQAETHALFYDI